jgi:hypothetical protein
MVSGVIIGIGLINWAVRTGRTSLLEEDAKASLAQQRGLFEREERTPAAMMTVRPASIEPLAIHFGITAVAILIGQLVLTGLQQLEQALWADTVEIFESVPLFPLAMLGRVLVQVLIDRYDRFGVVDRTPAYEAFGYQQLGFEPFFGGGPITATSVPLIVQFGPVGFLLAMAALLVLSVAVGLLRFGRREPDPELLARAEADA